MRLKPKKPVKELVATVAEQKQVIWEFLLKLSLFCLALWILFAFIFGIRRVTGESMFPRVRDGDLILFYRLEQTYSIDDVVAYKAGGYRYVGRIVAQGGDVVDLTDEGQLVVNGNVQEEEDIYYITEPRSNDGISFPYTVEEGSYFVLDDYRTAGAESDSRRYGAISKKNLEGKVMALLRRRGI
jgi:signal peptidase I